MLGVTVPSKRLVCKEAKETKCRLAGHIRAVYVIPIVSGA